MRAAAWLSGERGGHVQFAEHRALLVKGDGPAARALKKAPADLTQLAKRNGGKFPTDRIRRHIDGTSPPPEAHGSREMPVWGNALKQIDASAPGISYRIVTLTSHLESLQAK